MTSERRAAVLPLFSCLVVAIFVSGCSTMQRVDTDSGEPLANLVEAGDEVKITTLNDDVVEFVVIEIVDVVIVGNEQTIAIEDIKQLEVKTLSVPATVGLVTALTVIGLQVLGVSAASSFVPLGY